MRKQTENPANCEEKVFALHNDLLTFLKMPFAQPEDIAERLHGAKHEADNLGSYIDGVSELLYSLMKHHQTRECSAVSLPGNPLYSLLEKHAYTLESLDILTRDELSFPLVTNHQSEVSPYDNIAIFDGIEKAMKNVWDKYDTTGYGPVIQGVPFLPKEGFSPFADGGWMVSMDMRLEENLSNGNLPPFLNNYVGDAELVHEDEEEPAIMNGEDYVNGYISLALSAYYYQKDNDFGDCPETGSVRLKATYNPSEYGEEKNEIDIIPSQEFPIDMDLAENVQAFLDHAETVMLHGEPDLEPSNKDTGPSPLG